MIRNRYTLLVFVLLMQIACVKDKPNPEMHSLPQYQQNGIIVLNEGAYGNNNAELSFIDLKEGTVLNKLYQTANNKSLGDVANDIVLINDCFYIAVNNSGKIAIVSKENFEEIKTIHPIQFPRRILKIDSTKAYVSALYYPRVYVINLQTNELEKIIITDYANTENMLKQGKYVWCTNWDTASNLIYKINTETDMIEDKIMLPGRASHDIVEDKTGKLWILSGNKYKGKKSFLTCVNPANHSIVKTFSFDAEADPFRLQLNRHKDTLFFLQVNYHGNSPNNGVYRMDIDAQNLPGNAWLTASENSYFWALGIDTLSGNIFVSDPKGFTQQSTVYQYSSTGSLMQQYQAGIGANSFLFR